LGRVSGPAPASSPEAHVPVEHPGAFRGLQRAVRLTFLLTGAVLLVDATVVEPNWILVGRSIEHVPALPPRSRDLVVAHLSDLHVARLGFREKRAITLLREARPDIILISGDLVRGPASVPALENFLRGLRAPYGVYVVWGNHDHADGIADEEGARAVRRAGAVLLNNASVRIGDPARRMHVAGVDDPVSGNDNLRQAMRGVPRRDVCLLLAHTPAIARDIGNWDIDLLFVGNTHAGQVRLPLLGALYLAWGTRGFAEGWFDAPGGARMHVSRGLGWSWLPVRFFCPPRIDLITLRGGPAPRRGAASVLGRT